MQQTHISRCTNTKKRRANLIYRRTRVSSQSGEEVKSGLEGEEVRKRERDTHRDGSSRVMGGPRSSVIFNARRDVRREKRDCETLSRAQAYLVLRVSPQI